MPHLLVPSAVSCVAAAGPAIQPGPALCAALEDIPPAMRAKLPADLPAAEAMALAVMWKHGYDAAEAVTGWSRGRIYALATRLGVRKTEARITERRRDRLARQWAMFHAQLGATQTADVLDYLEDSVPDASVQLWVTSPPYNLGKRYGGSAAADNAPFLSYLGWMLQVLSELARTLKPGGTLFLQLGMTRDEDGDLMPLDTLLYPYAKMAGLTFQNRVIWRLAHGLTPKGRLAGRYETALVFTKGPSQVFNANAVRIPQRNPGKRAYKGEHLGQLSGHAYGAWPTDVWDDIPSVRANHRDRRHATDPRDGAHPAQFPLGLAKRAILLYTNPGDVVGDCFSGSGTSQVGAIETGRAFTGCDLFYAEARAARVAEATLDDASPLPGVTDESRALWLDELERQGLSVHRGPTSDRAIEPPVWAVPAVPVQVPASTQTPEQEQLQLLEFCKPFMAAAPRAERARRPRPR